MNKIRLVVNNETKKNEREKLGSVNLRADEETEQYKSSIIKMEKDREDLVSAISKLRTSINELNEKGRIRILDAFSLALIIIFRFEEIWFIIFKFFLCTLNFWYQL